VNTPGRRYVACILVLTCSAPGIASLSVAAHLATHHSVAHDSAGATANGLDIVLHGHHHETGTPRHDHRLLVPAAVSGRERRPSPPATVAGWLVPPVKVDAPRSACRMPAEQGLDPPHARDATIVILRI